jgi:glyoxylase-like metal-dependent hydrolase (beta-lactamase superfamily II)
MLEHMASQPVEGAKNVTICPYIRRVDLMSSNSYILAGEDQIALIDPGGMDDQLAQLEREIARLQEELYRPVVIYLTHVHIDHWIQIAEGRLQISGDPLLAAQEKGAACLESADPRATLAANLERPMIGVPVKVKLLSDRDKATAGVHSLDVGGWSLDYLVQSTELDGLLMHSQTIPLGRRDQLEIYHTPGHSPDSICIQSGSLLFVGDLFFAPNPGMAGAYGWSQQDLIESIQKVLWILENKEILLCCSGHGRPIDAETAKKTLTAMYRDTAMLKGLEEISPEWITQTSAYAQDLMSELERAFIIIAGRLAFIAHVLAELEEKEGADELDALLQSDLVDDMFTDFRRFAGELHAGKRLDWEMVHKAGQIVGRLDKLFERKKLGFVLDQSLIRRVGRLISDYSATYRGFRPPYYAEYADVNKLIGETFREICQDPYEDTAILEAESDEEYARALKMRIAHVNLFENIDLIFEPDLKNPFANMDKERFSDALIDILERFAAAGAKEIRVNTAHKDDWTAVRILGTGDISCNPLTRIYLRFFERYLSLCGGLIQTEFKEDCAALEIEFYSQDI